MRFTLLTVGKTDVAWVRDGLEMYVSRLSHYVPFTVEEIPALKGAGSLSRDQIKEREGEAILARIRPGSRVILLDERGKELRSTDFAKEIEKMLAASRDVVYVIGGAYGFSKAVYDRAEGLLSLSQMTFSHQMVRTIFAEQLYRAFTILKGEPYHHEG